jgi:hypothetical protein
MKKVVILVFVAIMLLLVSHIALADWEITLNNSFLSGTFDYLLHHTSSDESQLASKVSMPQDQNMVIIEGKYKISNSNNFWNFIYGSTKSGFKGRGSDSDWQNDGTLYHYGDMDFEGKQTLIAVDFGTTLNQIGLHTITLFGGFEKRDTTNELKNVIYHLINSVDVGNRTQDDNGSTLDGEFLGVKIGVNDDIRISTNFSFSTGLTASWLRAKAYGQWNKYTPAWNWTDTGNTIGYTADVSFKYHFKKLSCQVGYHYNYLKANSCRETLNGISYTPAIDLKYETKGFYLGITYKI